MKKAAFLDIDGTLHDGYTVVNFLYSLQKQGFISKESINTLNHFLHNDPRRYHDYENWCIDVDAITLGVFAGHSKETFLNYLLEFQTELEKNLFPYTIPLINLLKSQDFEIILITGSLNFIAENFAKIFEIAYENVIGSKLLEENGMFLSQYQTGYLMDGNNKKDHIIKLGKEYDLSKSIVAGDSESDYFMFPLVGKAFLITEPKTSPELLKKVHQINGIILSKESPPEEIVQTVKENLP